MKYQTSFLKIIFTVLALSILLLNFFLVTGCHSSNEAEVSTSTEIVDSLDYYTRLIISSAPEDKERAYLLRARLFYQKNAFDAALKDIRSALLLDSTHMETYLLKSQVEMDYFRSMDALRTLLQAQKKWPESSRIKVELAQTYLILRQYEDARQQALDALSNNPLAAKPYLILGIAARENQDTTSAIEYLQEAVQNDADLLDAWIELARLQMKRNPDKAAPYFESALQIAPEDLRIWHAYAMYWQNRDSLHRAVETYDQMIRQDSQYLEAYYNQALILMDQDSFGKAIPLLDQYIKRSERPAKGYYYRGICQEMAYNYDDALRDYTKARELNPNLESIDDAIRSMKGKVQ